MESCGIIITARVKSSRLENKVLQKINGKYAIDILLDHLINDYHPVILAIPENKDDDILEEIGTGRGIDVYRGQDESPLHRLAAVANAYNFDYVARITADDILIDLFLLIRQINFTLRGRHEYTYMKRCPEGIAGEIIKTSILNDVIKKVGNRSIEFISYYIKNQYKTIEYMPGFEYQFRARLTMDYEEDLSLLRVLYSALVNPGTLDIINFLKKNRYFLEINHQPEVTVYTCNYNTSKYIIDCMDSVFKQSFTDYEYIIYDDNSTDGSMNVITEYYSGLNYQNQKKTKVLRNEKNLGLPATCNKALSISRGRYIVRLDSDDRYHPDYLEHTVERARLENSHAVLTGYNKTDEALNIINICGKNEWHPSCALLSRWVVNEIKYRDGVEFSEGTFFWNDFKKHYKHSFIEEPLWDYRTRPGQKTQNKNHPNNQEVLK